MHSSFGSFIFCARFLTRSIHQAVATWQAVHDVPLVDPGPDLGVLPTRAESACEEWTTCALRIARPGHREGVSKPACETGDTERLRDDMQLEEVVREEEVFSRAERREEHSEQRRTWRVTDVLVQAL